MDNLIIWGLVVFCIIAGIVWWILTSKKKQPEPPETPTDNSQN